MNSTICTPEEKTFEANAVKLNYLEWGPGAAEPLVTLHGGAWCWQEYLSVLPSLAERWHTYSLDLRGNGRSGWVPDAYRLKDFVADNAQFLGQLRAPAVLVGHSIGGVIALMLAAQCPDRVKALIVEDVPLTLDGYQKVVDSSRDMFGIWVSLKKAARSEAELALALTDAYKGYPGVTSGWVLFFARCLWLLDPTFFNNLLYDFDGFTAGFDGKEIVSRIDCPVLFLRGEAKLGAVMPEDDLSWLQQRSRNVKCVLVDGVGHLLHLEERGQEPVLTAMMAFLEGK